MQVICKESDGAAVKG